MIRRVLDWSLYHWSRFRLAHLPLGPASGTSWLSKNLAFDDLRQGRETELPRLANYERLAAHYDTYANTWSTRYSSYLVALRRRDKKPLRNVLDLGCGTGGLVRQLARSCERVVGLDSSPAMLERAREACDHTTNTEFVAGDFCRFDLSEHFEAITCVSDSLNYLPEPSALGEVVANVERHLKQGGVFLLDFLPDAGMRLLSGKYLHHQSAAARFVLSFNYDPQTRRERTFVIFREGVECHDRIALEPADVYAACANSRLTIQDEFQGSLHRQFFVLGR